MLPPNRAARRKAARQKPLPEPKSRRSAGNEPDRYADYMEYDIFEAVAMSMGRQYQRAEEAEARRGGRGGAGAAEGSGRFGEIPSSESDDEGEDTASTCSSSPLDTPVDFPSITSKSEQPTSSLKQSSTPQVDHLSKSTPQPIQGGLNQTDTQIIADLRSEVRQMKIARSEAMKEAYQVKQLAEARAEDMRVKMLKDRMEAKQKVQASELQAQGWEKEATRLKEEAGKWKKESVKAQKDLRQGLIREEEHVGRVEGLLMELRDARQMARQLENGKEEF